MTSLVRMGNDSWLKTARWLVLTGVVGAAGCTSETPPGGSNTRSAKNAAQQTDAASCSAGESALELTQGAYLCVEASWRLDAKRSPTSARHSTTESGAAVDTNRELRKSVDGALQRLRDIELEDPGPYSDLTSDYLEIAGFPALIKRWEGPLSRPVTNPRPAIYLNLALAYGTEVLRVRAVLPGPDREAKADDLVERFKKIHVATAAATSRSAGQLEQLRRGMRFGPAPRSAPSLKQGAPGGPSGGVSSEIQAVPSSATQSLQTAATGINTLINNGNGVDSEIEVAASADGRVLVVANNGRDLTVSTNGGGTFSTSAFFPGAPFSGLLNGDPSLAVGVSGSFYFAFIGFPGGNTNQLVGLVPCTSNADPTCNAMSHEIASAAEADLISGTGFGYLGPMVQSPQVSTAAASCFLPDQEHIAADRANPSTTSPGDDLVYTTWRDFITVDNLGTCVTSGATCDFTTCPGAGCACAAADSCAQTCLPGSPTNLAERVSVRCSADGGVTWGNQQNLPAGTSYPRITVGPSGAVYVVYRTGANGGGNVELMKFASCDNPAGSGGPLDPDPFFPITVSTVPNIAGGPGCPTSPIPGIDRCNSGSELSSPVVAVDDRPVASTDDEIVYISFASTTAVGAIGTANENVQVVVSVDGGQSFTGPTQLSAGVTGRRFMPWVCATNGEAFVSWYDMRFATAAASDTADYFGVGFTADALGAVTVGTETRLSQVSDALCSTGWPNGTRCPGCAEACSVQPQQAGFCVNAAGVVSATQCDFSDCNPVSAACTCPAGSTCNTNGGSPKYGDYNGNACGNGRFYSAWASSTAPAGQGPTAGIDVFTACPQDPGILNPSFADTTDPIIEAPTDVNSNSCGFIDVGTPVAYDLCGPLPTVTRVPSGNTFLPGPPTVITWTATDAANNTQTDTQTVTITDIEPPVFTATSLPDLVVRTCDFGGETVTLVEPAATDNCSTPDVTGEIVASTNPSLALPLPIDPSGNVTVPPGTHTIEWTATDPSSNTSAPIEQTLTVGAALHATESVFVRNELSSLGGSVANDGTVPGGITHFENVTSGGDIISVPNVRLGRAASVGNIWREGTLTLDPPGNATFLSDTLSPVTLPAPLDLSGVVFPAPGGPTATANIGQTVPVAPGHYSTVAGNGGVLVLTDGIYFIDNLVINSGSEVQVGAETVIYATQIGNLQGPFVDALGDLANVFLGFPGTTLNMQSDFLGTLVAPNAHVTIGTASAQSFAGVLHARIIDVRNQATFSCEAVPCFSDVCGQSPPDICFDGTQNGDETDLDCGGSCSDCPDGSTCMVAADCESSVCPAGVCLVPTCFDGVDNGLETGVDCGGTCDPCPVACNEQTYQAENMFHSTGNAWWQGGWNLHSNGYISTAHDFSPGPSVITISALGQQAFGLPHMRVTVGGTAAIPTGGVNVAAGGFNDYQFTFTAAGGSQEIRVIFDNDLSGWFGDRNLIIDTVDVSCP